jgi:adenylate kinase
MEGGEGGIVDLIILGAPGSGKGTQGALLAQRLGIPKISTGDLLRAAVKDGTPLGRKAQGFMDQGLLVPDEIILGLIAEVLQSREAARGVIMDGFPRTLPQAEAVDRLLRPLSRHVDRVLLIDVTEDELVDRMVKRARIEGRADDTPETIRKRQAVYREQTAPLIAFYEERGIVRRVDGLGTIEEIATRMEGAATG